MNNVTVGHAMGTLHQIRYLNYYGVPHNAFTEAKDSILSIWHKYEPKSEVLNYIDSSGLYATPRLNYGNWSTANIEVPYHCSTCNSLLTHESDECEECSPNYVH